MQNRTRVFDYNTLRYRYVDNAGRVEPTTNVESLLRRGDADTRAARFLSDFGVLHWPNEFDTWEQRRWPTFDYDWVWSHIKEEGVGVRCDVVWLTTVETTKGSGDPESQLLAIKVTPLRGEFFPMRRPPHQWMPWHVSICYRTDKDEHGNLIWTRDDLAHLLRKFDGTEQHLWLADSDWPTGSVLELNEEWDPIASDPIVQKLHSKGYYYKRKIHISM
jgi:hypothetical protein